MTNESKALAALKEEHAELVLLIAESEGESDPWGWHRQMKPDCKTCAVIATLESQPVAETVSREVVVAMLDSWMSKPNPDSKDGIICVVGPNSRKELIEDILTLQLPAPIPSPVK